MGNEIKKLRAEVNCLRELVVDLLAREDKKAKLARLKEAKINRCPTCLREIE